MKASEMIKLLQAQIAEKGDQEVFLHGMYGAVEATFEPMGPELFSKSPRNWLQTEDDPKHIHIWTGICTG